MAHRVEHLAEGVSIHLGDAREIVPTLANVGAIITDPPFKVSQTYSATVDADNLEAVSSIWPVAQSLRDVANAGAVCVVFYDNRILPLALQAFRHAGWRYLRSLTLYRRWGQASLVNGWMSTSDLALVFVKPGAKPLFAGPCKHDVYVKDAPEAESFGHPAQKPLQFVSDIVANSGSGLVLDPYLGSGTTGVAAVRAGRPFVGIEREQAFFDTACRRIEAELSRPSATAARAISSLQGALFA